MFDVSKREPPFSEWFPWKPLIFLDFLLAEVALQQAFESLAMAGLVARHPKSLGNVSFASFGGSGHKMPCGLGCSCTVSWMAADWNSDISLLTTTLHVRTNDWRRITTWVQLMQEFDNWRMETGHIASVSVWMVRRSRSEDQPTVKANPWKQKPMPSGPEKRQ